MTQAKLGKVTALHSAPCYTKKQYEYEYYVGLYLQGFMKTTDHRLTDQLPLTHRPTDHQLTLK